MGFPYTVNKRQNIHVNRIANSFLYSFLLHVLLRDLKTLEVVKMNTILHSHEVWLSQSVQKTLWDREKCEEPASLVSLQLILLCKKYPLSQQAGLNGEKRGALSSWVWKRGPLREKFTLIYRNSLSVILSIVWYPAALPGKPTIQKQCLNPWSYLTWYQGPSWPLLQLSGGACLGRLVLEHGGTLQTTGATC